MTKGMQDVIPRDTSSIGLVERLREEMSEEGMPPTKNKELAAAIGVSEAQMSQVVHGAKELGPISKLIVLDKLGYEGVSANTSAAGLATSYYLTPPRTYGFELQVRY